VVIVLAAIAVVVPAAPAFGLSTTPGVTGVWPRSGPVVGGGALTVVGSGFTDASAVTVAGVATGAFTVVSDNVMQVTVPPSDAGVAVAGDVTVTTPGGTSRATPLDTYAYRAGGTSIMVPSYIYPGTAWSQIDAGHPPVDLAIINPASGPGTARDANYAAQVSTSQSSGVDVVGYVHTSYGSRSLRTVENEISEYESWYHLDGIFVDEAATSCTLEASYYAPLYAFIHAQAGLDLTILNPGQATNQCYMAAADVVLGFEGTPADLASAGRPPSWMAGFAPGRFWAVVYGASGVASERSVLATLAGDGYGEVYVTDRNLPNPYGTLPSYWVQEVADASGSGSVTSPIPQVVTFTSVPPAAAVGATYTVAVTGGASGQPVRLTVDPASGPACTIAGSSVTFAAVGTCVIDANQAGTAAYAPAAQAQQQIVIGVAPVTSAPLITSAAGYTVPAGQSFTFTFTATGTPTPTIRSSNSLPSGVRFTANRDGTATLSGSVRRRGTYRFTISATNGVGRGTSQSFTLTVS
jgi:hypothetical protein